MKARSSFRHDVLALERQHITRRTGGGDVFTSGSERILLPPSLARHRLPFGIAGSVRSAPVK
jgi:hypothetical protein